MDTAPNTTKEDAAGGTGRSPGRPRGDSSVRERLLEAARQAFAQDGFRGASIRRIAQAAGATPAMAHYYFGDKSGLYQAMLEHTLEPLLAEVRGEAQRALEGGDPIARFVHAYMGRLAAAPEIAVLLVRDVLAPGGEMRDAFVTGFARHGADAVRGIIRHEIGCGRLRRDLDPNLAALSLLRLCAFPFLAAPVAGRALDYTADPEHIERLAAHTITLFFRGAEAAS